MEETRGNRQLRIQRRIRRLRLRHLVVPMRRLKDRQNPYEIYDCIQFKKRFHVHKETALFVTDLIKDGLQYHIKRGAQIPPYLQYLICQRYFATGSLQIVIGDVSTVTQPTVSNIVKRVSFCVAKLRTRYVVFPKGHDLELTRQAFYHIGQFPGVVGAIDGCQIRIRSPGGEDAELFRNRKDFFAINVQGICSASLNFTNIVARWYGSAHDSRIFENSTIGMEFDNGRHGGILLGDSGYPQLPYLMTPLANPTTVPEKRYQRAQLRTRNTIERCFGVWKRRFPCLNDLRMKLPTSLAVIVATAVMHNISRKRNDILDNDEYDPEESDDDDDPIPAPTLSGKQARARIILTHFST